MSGNVGIGGLGGLILLLALGCENYREWRDEKAKQPASTQQVSDDPVPPRKQPSAESTAATYDPAAPHRRSKLDAPVTRPSGSIGSAVLMVNRDYVTAEEVIRRIHPQLESTALTYSASSYRARGADYVTGAVRDIISETLLYQEIAARITEEQNPPIDKAVDKEVNALALSEAGGSKVLLEKMLTEQGSNMEELKKQLRKQIVTQQYLRERMKPKVIITRDDLWNYYQANQDQFAQPAQVHLLLIEIDPNRYLPAGTDRDNVTSLEYSQARAKADAQVKSLSKALADGKDFSELAKAYSTASSARSGGEMGWITRGSYRIKQVEDEAFKMNVGAVSRPIIVEQKTYVLKVVELRPERVTVFSQAQDAIRQALEKDLYRRLVMQHLNTLWGKSQIGPIEPFVEEVCTRLPDYETVKQKAEKKPKGKNRIEP